MIEIEGKYNKAKVFTNVVEDTAREQIKTLCSMEIFKDSKIRIMPDVHAGAGCVIGFTADLKDKVICNLVGVDIGCGVLTSEIPLDLTNHNFEILDNIIRSKIPSGFRIRKRIFNIHDEYLIEEVERISKDLLKEDYSKHLKSIGTLGGGNHFIEVNKGTNKNYLVIHTGSRNFGYKIAQKYQKLAEETCSCLDITKGLEYLEGELANNYLRDMKVAQLFAFVNRVVIQNIIFEELNIEGVYEIFDTIHNFIDEENIIRKGAVKSLFNQKLIIPINMRDGSMICVGKGNSDWNYSAPHGAGRILSRTKAKKILSLNEFEKQMEGIYSTSIKNSTIDESPMVYKNINDIIDNIEDTVEVQQIIKPVYNFKA